MTISRRQSLAVLFAAAAAPSTAFAQAANPWTAVDTAAAALIATRATPGVQICVRKQGRTLYSKAFGSANLEDQVALTPKGVLKIGSVTKQFSAALVLLLAQDGKLGLDDTLARHFPDFPRAGDITLRRMLSHTSGLGNYTDGPSRRATYQMMRPDYDPAELLTLMKTGKTQAFEPETVWAYSNTAYVLLGLVIEKVASKSYDEFARERLFGPLGLSATAVDDSRELLPGRVAGYSNDPKAPSGFANASFIAMSVPGGAGNMRSSCVDLCAWHEGLLGGRVLKPDMLKTMLTPARVGDGQLPKDARGREIEYGFGLQLASVEGRKCIAHGGGINGFASDLRTFPEAGVTIAHIFNTDGGVAPVPAHTADRMLFRRTLMLAALA